MELLVPNWVQALMYRLRSLLVSVSDLDGNVRVGRPSLVFRR